jgi:tetrapyrrole methylase family protein/MazG family protein
MTSQQILDPAHPFLFDPTAPLAVINLETAEERLRAYRVLRKSLRDDDRFIFHYADGSERELPLRDLAAADGLTEAHIIPLPPEEAPRSLAGAIGIVARLRGPDGCPWDREQTPESLIRFVIEEAYEVGEAIRRGDAGDTAEELGDVLLQVLLQSEIAAETGAFTLGDVLETLDEKLIRRHPHVFADGQAGTAADVEKSWDAIKQSEKAQRPSALHGAGKGLPALMAAQAVLRRARSTGFDWPTSDAIWAKLEEEIQELREAESPSEIEHELGDVIFMLTRIALIHDLDAESVLQSAIERVHFRFGHLERQLIAAGSTVAEATTDEKRALWNEAKALEKQPKEA